MRSPRRVLVAASCAALCVSALGCTKDEDTVWVQFNAETDSVFIEITSAVDLGDTAFFDLHSTSGSVIVGEAAVDPSFGPVGTDHELTVDVADEWQEIITRVTVVADAGSRGADEFEFSRDSADHGQWWVGLTSVGDEGEERTDVFTVRLWQEVPADEVAEEDVVTGTTGE